VRSGLLGHGRTDSINGSIGPVPTSPLASPRDPRSTRRSSEWGATEKDAETGDDGDASAKSIATDNEGKGKAKVV
jgi:hypothetical protein